ncbi:cytochrome b [Amylibacter kogurei]|uniref:Cytochrome b n=1 Tax=Paramylibacter kogurei TaxID=1889778 RepID=A0A2G5K8G6_9RHOB|nr:YqaA family protein [Amylibacter kogurei]PIB24984.1 cytochrome b [Amylibacter kogurei]
MLRKLYDWTLSFADSPYSLWILAAISFVESSVFPIPPHVLMIPLIIAQPHRAFLFAAVATIASVAGGALGYYIGAELFDSIGRPVLDFYHKADAFDAFAARFNEQGHWAVLAAGVTPFPYKVITITSGATGLPFASFMFWSLIARSIIFFVIAGLLWKFGAPIRDFIEKRLPLMFTLFIIALIGGFYVVKYL